MGLLDDFERGTGMFGFTAMSNERKLARQIGPALAGILGQEINTSGQVAGDAIRAGGMVKATGMKEQGDTFRQRLLNDAQILMRDMMEKGATQREGMQQGGANYRTNIGEEGAMQRLKKQALLQENAFDKILMSKYAMGGQSSSPDIGVVDSIEKELAAPGGSNKKKSSYSFGSLSPFEDYLDNSEYSSGSW